MPFRVLLGPYWKARIQAVTRQMGVFSWLWCVFTKHEWVPLETLRWCRTCDRLEVLRPVKVSTTLARVDTPEGRRRLAEYLNKGPFPHFEPGPDGILVRIEADGRRTPGRFVGREWIPQGAGNA